MSDPTPPNTEAATPSYAPPGSGTAVATPPDAGPPPTTPAGFRYHLHAELARGGMGVVYRATDAHLRREVAVKVLSDRFAPDSGVARRFLDEAVITGQLQHPGIPPVHDLGTLPDGRPFLAMKLIKGETLDDLLKARRDPSADRGRFLGAFEAICQAVGYAHAHGVIHRDLKPQNVMVGAFGEVQVMDWGLAKVLTPLSRETESSADPDATTPNTAIHTDRDSDNLLTRAGSVLGTPAYMPPEQAIGAVDQIDQRSDVFGLGGILATILTGQPPFVGDTAESTRQLAARGKVDDCFARLDGCGAEPELVALCKRCLAPEKSDRPADAREMARTVAALRASADERARQAELDRVKAEGDTAAAELRLTEGRKRRRLALAYGSLVLAITTAGGLGVGLQWIWRARAERQATDERTQVAEQNAAERWQSVVAMLELTTRMDQFIADRPTLNTDDREYLNQMIGIWLTVSNTRGETESARAARAEGHYRRGALLIALGYDRETNPVLFSPRDKSSQEYFRDAEIEYLAACDTFSKLSADFPQKSDYRSGLARGQARLGQLLHHVGRKIAAAEMAYRDACKHYESLAAGATIRSAERIELANTRTNLGDLLRSIGKVESAEGEYRAALVALDGVVDDHRIWPTYRQGSARVQATLGTLLSSNGRHRVAEPMLRVAISTYGKLVLDYPIRPDNRLGLATAHANLGSLLSTSGREIESISAWRVAIGHWERLVEIHPSVSDYRIALASHQTHLASKQAESGRLAEAESLLRSAVAIHQRTRILPSQRSTLAAAQVSLGETYESLGQLLCDTGRPADSLEWFTKSIERLQQIYRGDPRQESPKLLLRNSHWGRAVALDQLGQAADALADWNRAIELSPPDEQPNPRVARAVSLIKAGRLEQGISEVDALAALQRRWTPGQYHDFARAYAVAARTSTERQDEYAGRAVGFLLKAAAGQTDAAHMWKDADLDPLRSRPDFQRLLADLGAAREPAPKPRRPAK